MQRPIPKLGWKGWAFAVIGFFAIGDAAQFAGRFLSSIGNVQTLTGLLALGGKGMTWAFGPHWTDSDGYRFLCLIVFLGCALGIKWSADREARKSALGETEARREATRIPILMIKRQSLEADLRSLETFKNHYQNIAEQYRAADGFWNEDQVFLGSSWFEMNAKYALPNFAHPSVPAPVSFGFPLLPNFHHTKPILDRHDGAIMDIPPRRYTRNANVAYMATRTINNQLFEKWLAELEDLCSHQRADLGQIVSELDARLMNFN